MALDDYSPGCIFHDLAQGHVEMKPWMMRRNKFGFATQTQVAAGCAEDDFKLTGFNDPPAFRWVVIPKRLFVEMKRNILGLARLKRDFAKCLKFFFGTP